MASKLITEMTRLQARSFLMKHTSYVNFELPPYIDFTQLLTLSSAFLGRRQVESFYERRDGRLLKPKNYDDVNYTVLSNKDGAFSWRPMQIIHPVLYVDLVNVLTKETNWNKLIEKFTEFSNSYVECISIPRESDDNESDRAWTITNWWESIEQETIKQSLNFSYIAKTDITDCYGSIYTHTFAWALDEGGKAGAKERKISGHSLGQDGLGGVIDGKLTHLNNGQTNGIPQGSSLMDFLAEIVLGYADVLLTERIMINTNIKRRSFKILRYRDDYSILADSPIVGNEILKQLDLVLYELGLKMSPSKTKTSMDVIGSAIKPEKMESIYLSPSDQTFQKRAARIYQIAQKHPNSGLVARELSEFYDDFSKYNKNNKYISYDVLISIFVMIGIYSPRYVHLVSSIISKIFKRVNDIEKIKKTMKQIISKFNTIPNSGLLDIWLQRISEPLGLNHEYDEPFTKVVLHQVPNSSLWNNEWLHEDGVQYIDSADISSLPERIENQTISYVVERKEFELYKVADY